MFCVVLEYAPTCEERGFAMLEALRAEGEHPWTARAVTGRLLVIFGMVGPDGATRDRPALARIVEAAERRIA